MKLSLQLYSVRNEIKQYGLKEVLAAAKKAGFDAVEPAGYYDLGAAGLKKELDAAGLSVTSAHISYKAVTEETQQVIDDMKALGATDVVIPWLSADMLKDQFDELAEKLCDAQKVLKKSGLRLGYHNHAQEFEGGADYVKKFLENVDGLLSEPDIFWLAVAGKLPIDYVKSIESKLMTIHLKELGKGGKAEPNPVLGQGVSQTAQCIAFAAEKKLPYIVLEFEGASLPYEQYLCKCAEFIRAELKRCEK